MASHANSIDNAPAFPDHGLQSATESIAKDAAKSRLERNLPVEIAGILQQGNRTNNRQAKEVNQGSMAEDQPMAANQDQAGIHPTGVLTRVESLVRQLARHYGLNPEQHQIIAKILKELRG